MHRLPVVFLLCFVFPSVFVVLFAAEAPPPVVTFDVDRTVLWEGRSQVVPFTVAAPTQGERTFEARVTEPEVLEILQAPRVLGGERIGYLRVRAARPGMTTLEIAQTKLSIEVKERRVELDEEIDRPRIISPVRGARSCLACEKKKVGRPGIPYS